MSFGRPTVQLVLRSFVALLAVLGAITASARASDGIFSRDWLSDHLDVPKAQDILVEHLRRMRPRQPSDDPNLALFDNSGSMLMSLMPALRTDAKLCEDEIDELMQECLTNDLLKLVSISYDQKKIDELEFRDLRKYSKRLRVKDNRVFFVLKGTNPIVQAVDKVVGKVFKKWSERQKSRTDVVPVLSDYEAKVNFFEQRRLGAGRAADLDPKVIEQLRDAYRRRIKGAGRVTPVEYVLAAFSREQINTMSDMMLETTTWMDSGEAKIILMRKGLSEKLDRIDVLESEIERLAVQTTQTDDDAKRAQLERDIDSRKQELFDLRKSVEEADTAKKIQDLKAQRLDVSLALAEVPAGDDHQDERDQDLAQLDTLDTQIDDLEDKLSKEITTIQLDPSDVERLAMNHLEIQMENARRAGLLKRLNISKADLVVASYITGELSGMTITALLKYYDDLKEAHETILKKAGKLVWAGAKMYLMINPYTMVPTTMAVVVIEALKNKKLYEQAAANKTHLIRR